MEITTMCSEIKMNIQLMTTLNHRIAISFHLISAQHSPRPAAAEAAAVAAAAQHNNENGSSTGTKRKLEIILLGLESATVYNH